MHERAGSLGGDPNPPELDSTFALVYEELRRIARRALARERPGHTLQTTALVNEAYLKLRAQRAFAFQDDTHFLALAARAMRPDGGSTGRSVGAVTMTAVRGFLSISSRSSDSLAIIGTIERR